MPEEEAEQLDEQSVAVDDFAARLRGVENDLVDAYVRGSLEGETLERFESFYMASRRRREKVKFAERFVRAVARASASDAVVTPASNARDARRWRSGWPLAAAAALILASGTLVFEEVRLRHESAAFDNRTLALARQLDAQSAENNAMLNELNRVRVAQPNAAIALVLLPQTRAVGPVSVIALRPGAGVVAFDLQLEAIDSARYVVALKDPGTNRIVWRSDTLMPGPSRRPASITVAIPAAVLKPQHYSLELSGRNSAGAFDIIGSYAFQIQSR